MATKQGTQGQRKKLGGVVVSTGMNKTIVVSVSRKIRHARYQKYMTSRTKFFAHDEREECRVGDEVEIIETRPLSKRKRWRLLEIKVRSEGARA